MSLLSSKKHMIRLIFFITLCLLQFHAVKSQFSGIDASNFSTIRAYGGGAIFTNAKPSDFTVTENGLPMTNGMSVSCSTAVDDPSVSVVLVIDISESMNEKMSNGRSKLEWMKNGAKNFVNSLIFNGTTQCAIITFNGNSYILSDFQSTARPLIDAIDKIQYGIGATNYDDPLIDPQNSAVALLKKTPAWVRRAVVFLTDGTPNQQPQTTSIINQLSQLKATLYAIALSFDASPDLRRIAEMTGGTTNVANTEELLVNIYKELGSKRPTSTYCWLSYNAPFGCTESSRTRNVQITYKPTNLRQNFTYTAPSTSIAILQTSVVSLPPFPDIAPGQSANQQFTITAKNSACTVTGEGSTLPANFSVFDWGGSAPPFTLQKDQSRIITVRFTQTSPRDIRSGRIRINANPCNSDFVSLSGGSRKVVLVSPNGGEFFSACDSTLITWGGVEATDTVRLQYSTNGGSSWHLISNRATGLSFTWKPPFIGQFLLRVIARTTRTGGIATIKAGGAGNDNGLGIGVSPDASSWAITGNYEKQMSLGNQQITSTRIQDLYIARFRDSSLLWLKTGTNFLTKYLPYTAAIGKTVLVDSNDNLIHACDITRTVNGGRVSIILSKISSTGNVDWSKEILGTQKSIAANYLGKDSIGNYYLSGVYDGQLSVAIKSGGNNSIIAAGLKPFTLIFNEFGDILSLKDSIVKGYPLFPADTARDTLGNLYTTRTFVNTVTFSDTSLTSTGKQDIGIRVNGIKMTYPDQSDAPFTIVKPLLSISSSKIQLGSSNVGTVNDTVINALLCNRSNTSITLGTPILNGIGSSEMSIIEPLSGTIIESDSCIPVRIRYSPNTPGTKNVSVQFGNDCVYANTIIEAEALSIGATISNLDWGMRRVQTSKQLQTYLVNTGANTITINSIGLQNGTMYSIINPLQLPYTLKSNDSIAITIGFTPLDTIQYSDAIIIQINEMLLPLQANLIGIGGLPVFGSNNIAFMRTKVGTLSSEKGNVYTVNHSNSMVLSIDKAILSGNQGDFTIESMNALPTKLTVSDTHTTVFSFRPLKPGKRTAYLVFNHDGAKGPEESPIAIDSIKIEGEGYSLSLEADSLVNMDTMLICDTKLSYCTVRNPNSQDIQLIDITIINPPGTTQPTFTTIAKAPIIIPAFGTARIPIQCTPALKGLASAQLHMIAEDSSIYTTQLQCYSNSIPSSLQMSGASQVLSLYPGEEASLTIQSSISGIMPSAVIDTMRINISYNPSLLTLKSVDSKLVQWQWSIIAQDISRGTATLLGVTDKPIASLVSTPLCTMNFSSYLAKNADIPLIVETYFSTNCIDSSSMIIPIEVKPVCYNNARIVDATGVPLSIVKTQRTIHVSIPFDGFSRAYILDIKGRSIEILSHSMRSAGNYSLVLPNIPQGAYTIVLHNGMYTSTLPFINVDAQ